MKTLFSNKRRILPAVAIINLLVLSLIVIGFVGPGPLAHAQTADARQDPFSIFCNFYYHDGKDPQADTDTANCQKYSSNFLALLQQEATSANYAKWPHDASLSDLASQGALTNPKTHALIKTQQDFLVAIPIDDINLFIPFVFNGDSQFLPTLWGYNSTFDINPNLTPVPVAPSPAALTSPIIPLTSCGTLHTTKNASISIMPPTPNATPYPAINPPSPNSSPSISCIGQQPPVCPVSVGTFQNANLWSTAGPLLLTATSQALQNQNGQNLSIYDIYGRLLLQANCRISALTQAMTLNGGPVQQVAAAYQWERDTLRKVASDNASNSQLVSALNWAASQPDSTQVDSWFSSAIITNPVTPANQPATANASPTPGTGTSAPSTPGTGLSGQSTNIVKIQIVQNNGQFTISPSVVTVSKNTQIIWVNASSATHVIISDNGTSSSSLGPNGQLIITLNNSGTFTFHCGTHSSMKATITVTS